MAIAKAIRTAFDSVLKSAYGPDLAGSPGRAAAMRQSRRAQASEGLFGPTPARRRRRGRMTTVLSQGEDTGLGG